MCVLVLNYARISYASKKLRFFNALEQRCVAPLRTRGGGNSFGERAQLIKSSLHKAMLLSCMALTVLPGLSTIAVAQQLPIATNTAASTASGALTPQSFLQNPASLFSGGNASQNVVGLMSQGVNANAINSAITTFGGQAGLNTGGIADLTKIVSNFANGQNINPASAASLLDGVLKGQMSGDLGKVLSTIKDLGNITSPQGLANTIGQVGSLLNGKDLATQAGGLDQALKLATGQLNLPQGVSDIATKALGDVIKNAFPDLAKALGDTGLSAAINGFLGGASGTFSGLLGGATGTGGTSTGSSGGDTCSPQGCGGGPCQPCHTEIPLHYAEVRAEITSEFAKHVKWFLNTYWLEHILPALMLMAEQLTAVGIHQVTMIGAFLDAKHQLETQRLFQQMTAEAHKDYQPSEGMCTFGTAVRSLAGSERKSDIVQIALADRMNQRQLLKGDVVSAEGADSDIRSRLQTYIKTYCDQADNANGLSKLCPTAVPKPERRNIDVDYTRNVESRLTLDIDLVPTKDQNAAAQPSGANKPTEDLENLFALSANLFAHKIVPEVAPEKLADDEGRIRLGPAERYMDLRAVYAKRSVAQNSFAAITAMRAAGEPGSAPYTKALIKELGVESNDEIEKFLGKNPSYFAQMEILTKKIYQNPLFYTELYDKPANIQRKGAALQAIGLMQDRDFYNSLLRSEAVLAVLLETMLQREQEKVSNAIGKLNQAQGAKQ